MTDRLAIVLFNLGGPDRPASVKPFLFNLFNDKAIIGMPQPLRWLIARLISKRRTPVAQEIYHRIGGRSPILEETRAQAEALQELMKSRNPDRSSAVFICMRYWHPRARDVVKLVRDFAPAHIVLLPLYPQASTTTTRSSLEEWRGEAERHGLNVPTSSLCCYSIDRGLIMAHVEILGTTLRSLPEGQRLRVLFSAHGLPQRVVDRGDPYAWQVNRTARAVVDGLGIENLDWLVCYQSRVGPLKWIGPSTEEEIRRAARDKVGLVVVPIAFVSDHSETLVELDMEYASLAKSLGIEVYRRCPTVGVNGSFIEGLANLADIAAGSQGCGSASGQRECPPEFRQCLSGT